MEGREERGGKIKRREKGKERENGEGGENHEIHMPKPEAFSYTISLTARGHRKVFRPYLMKDLGTQPWESFLCPQPYPQI